MNYKDRTPPHPIKNSDDRSNSGRYPPLTFPKAPNASITESLPAQVPNEEGADIDIDTLLERLGDNRSSNLVRDTLWAYENLENRRIIASDAPSCGSWALLKWAREYRNRFFEQVLPKAMANKPLEDEEKYRKERKSITEIERLLEGFNQQFAEELAADVPKTVRARVRSTLNDWERQYALIIPNNAKTNLEALLSGLVGDCMGTLSPTSGER